MLGEGKVDFSRNQWKGKHYKYPAGQENSFHVCYVVIKDHFIPFPTDKQVLQEQRQLLHSSQPIILFLSYSLANRISQAFQGKGQGPLLDAWLHIKYLQPPQGT